jgi:hypothetical protein
MTAQCMFAAVTGTRLLWARCRRSCARQHPKIKAPLVPLPDFDRRGADPSETPRFVAANAGQHLVGNPAATVAPILQRQAGAARQRFPSPLTVEAEFAR